MSTERNDLKTVLDAEREKVKALLAAVGEQVAEDEDIPLACAVVEELHTDVETLTAQLDAEREKVKGLHEVTKVICAHCCEPMEIPSKAVLQTQLSQLQALVRALPRVDKIDYMQAHMRSGGECFGLVEALEPLLRYRAALDATTPATRRKQ